MAWNDRYVARDFPWDLGGPAPVVQALAARAFGAGTADRSARRILVPGCGRAWDVEALAARGHTVVGLDISPAALELARARIAGRDLPGAVEWVVGDVLVEPGVPPAGGQGFDGWVEHTCFCALDPSLWPRYVEAAWRRLKPGGVLFGAFLDFEGGGPPYGTDAAELRDLFGDRFDIEMLEPAGMFGPRGVPQLGAIFRRKR